MTSLYLSDQRAGPSAAASVSPHGSQGSDGGGGSGGVRSSRKGKERARDVDAEADPALERPGQRKREPSTTSSVDTTRATSNEGEGEGEGGSEVASVASVPVSAGSGNSYSAEMYDHLTPLREMYAMGVYGTKTNTTSKRRSVPTMGPIFDAAALDPPFVAPQQQQQAHAGPSGSGSGSRSAGPPSPSYQFRSDHGTSSAGRASPSMGLSEILATPSYREVNASQNAEYTTSPFERYSPSPGVQHGHVASREIDYFNLPISHREGSRSAHHHPSDRSSRGPGGGGVGDSSSSAPPRPQSEPLPEDTSTPSWSSSDITSATQSSSLRSPRIRNEGILAPHGSFTSDSGRQYQAAAKLKRAESLSRESASSSESVQSWRSRTASVRSTDGSGRRQLSERQYVDYVREAMNGDQLALYHLGWTNDRGHDRHSLGDAELVWGGAIEPTSPSAFSSRSSATSRPSLRSNSTASVTQSQSQSHSNRQSFNSQAQAQEDAMLRDRQQGRSHEGSDDFGGGAAERPTLHSRRSTHDSDLFSDVARMTLQSNARNNRAAAGQYTPPAVSSPQEHTRPAPSPALARPQSAAQRLEEANRQRDRDRERERARQSSSSKKDPSNSSGSASASARPGDSSRKRDETREERDARRALRKAKKQQQMESGHSAGSGSTMRNTTKHTSTPGSPSNTKTHARPAAGPLQPPPPDLP